MTGNMGKESVLVALVNLDKPLHDLEEDVSQLKWDDERSTVALSQDNVRSVLDRYLLGSLTSEEVEQWANLLEGREDIAAERSVRDMIHQLANPLLEGELSHAVARSLLAKLQ